MAHRQKFPNFEPEKTNGELGIYKMSRTDLTKKEMVEMKGNGASPPVQAIT